MISLSYRYVQFVASPTHAHKTFLRTGVVNTFLALDDVIVSVRFLSQHSSNLFNKFDERIIILNNLAR